MSISVIIPTLNEEHNLEDTLKSIGRGVEIIVVDGGSSDFTREIANDFTEKIILSERGRGVQMDRGAREASGDILLFLHADTSLPENWRGCIENVLLGTDFKSVPTLVVGGGFSLKIDSKGFSFRLIEAVANIRAKYLGLIYGDQAIFVRRDAFFSSGGFMGLPLMEDVDFIRRIRKKGKVLLLNADVSTSSRQWQKKGILKTTIGNLFFLSLYYAGVSPQRLYRLYYA